MSHEPPPKVLKLREKRSSVRIEYPTVDQIVDMCMKREDKDLAALNKLIRPKVDPKPQRLKPFTSPYIKQDS